jgi:hypothetical protein
VSVAAGKPPVALFIDPLSHHFEGDRLFDSSSSPHGGDAILEPYAHVRRVLAARGVPVHTADLLESRAAPAGDVNVYVTMGIRDRYRRLASRDDVVLSAFFVPECPVAEPALFRDLARASDAFRRMYSFSTDAALRPFLERDVHFSPFRFPQAFDDVHADIWSRGDRRFLTIINGNKVPRIRTAELYTERLRAVEHFSRTDEIDLYGIGWEGPPFRIGSTWVPAAIGRLRYEAERRWQRLVGDRDPLRRAARKAWRGAVASKAETLGGYTFAICFENMVLEGWITEKIFDCFFSGTVPVYLGAPDINEWIPTDCFVDMRRFAGYPELRDFLRSLSPGDIEGYRAAARDYLRSDAYHPFTKQAFAEHFEEILSEDGGSRA